MGDESTALLTRRTREELQSIFSGLSKEQATLITNIESKILSNLPQYTRIADFHSPAKKVDAIILQDERQYTDDEKINLRRALIAKLALHLPFMIEKMNLPDNILALYPDTFERLADFLKNSCEKPYNSTGEFFCKDVRFVLGLSVPCGTAVVDLISRVAVPTVILSLIRSGKVDGIIRYALAMGNGPWFRGHVDTRFLTEFNEQGFDNFYRRLAKLLEWNKKIRGYVGSSWLYDPQLLQISPKLAYLRKRPFERGAFFLQHGTKKSDVLGATKRSETRRRLYQEGKYIPICYSMLWPRNELIAWAKIINETNSHRDL